MILNIPPTLSQIRAGNLRVPLQFNADLTSQYDSAKTQILSSGTSGVNLLLGVPSTGFTLLKSGITNLFSAGSAQGVQNQNSWGVGVYGANVGGVGYAGFSSTGLSDILGNVPTGSSYKLSVQGVEKYRFSAALAEFDRLSLGGTLGSSTDPGAGGLGVTGNIQFTGAGTASSVLTTMWADAANGNLFTNVPTGKYEQHRVNGVGLLSLGRASSTQDNSYFSIGGYGSNGTVIGTIGGILGGPFSNLHNVPSGNTHRFMFNDVEKYRFAAALAEFDRLSLGGTIGSSTDPGAGGLSLTGNIQFTGTGTASSVLTTAWADASAGNLFSNVPTGKYEQHRVNGVGLLSLGRVSSTISNVGWAIGYFASDGALQAAANGIYGAAAGIVYNVPTSTSHTFWFNNVEKYRLSSTLLEAPSLSLGGTVGSSTDGGIGSLALTNRIQFVGAGTASSVLTSLWADASAGNLITNVPSSKYVELRIAGFTTYTFGYSYNLATTGANVFQIGDGSGSYIQSDGFGLLHRVSNTYAHTFKVNTTDVGYFDGNGLTVTKNIVSSNNSNTGGRTANLDVQRYYNNVFWGWPNSAYTCSMGSFDGAGYPFICFYGYHSSTTNTIKRSSATNQPVWFQSLSGYISIFQGTSGTADVDCTGTEKYRFDSIFQTDRMSIGTMMGSPVDQGSGGFYCTGNMKVNGTITITTSQSPASNGTGTAGQIAWDANYIYVCTATNTWKRAALTGGY